MISPWPTIRPCPFLFTRRGALSLNFLSVKGGVNSFLVTPVELVRTRLMLQFDRDTRSNPSSIKGPVDCIRRIVRRSGVRSMWQASARAAWRRARGRVFQAEKAAMYSYTW